MNEKRKWHRWITSVILATWIGTLPCMASSPPLVSQYIGATAPICDENGEVLEGTDPYAYLYGVTAVEGDVVQVILATDGVVHPPDRSGGTHSKDVVLLTSRIGLGMSPTLAQSGQFSAALSPRPDHGSKIYVRVFNAPSVMDATHYADSRIYTVNNLEFDVFEVDIVRTENRIDPSPEAYSFSVDSDGDGLSNGDEKLAGTDRYDADSCLTVASMLRAWDNHAAVHFKSVAGRTYVVEFRGDGDAEFRPVQTVKAWGPTTSVLIQNALSEPNGCFRVCVMQD